jgi:hypothetical protein
MVTGPAIFAKVACMGGFLVPAPPLGRGGGTSRLPAFLPPNRCPRGGGQCILTGDGGHHGAAQVPAERDGIAGEEMLLEFEAA